MRGSKYATEEERREALREAQRRYSRTENGREKYARYRETEGYRAAQERSKPAKSKNAIRWRAILKEQHPERVHAWEALGRAVRAGLIARPTRCQSCEREVRLDAHHHRGYAEEHQLDVIWLCRRCHKAAHREGVVDDG